MRYFILLLIFLSICPATFGQALKLTKGAVNENIAIYDSIKETFSLYVPRDFDPENAYKILFILDPDGSGIRASRLFLSEMVTDDFVIASNEWKLGDDLEANVALAASMVQRVVSSIRLDNNHIYAAGLEEGATTASGLTYILRGFSGLLLINDVFYKNEHTNQNNKEIFLGLVGNASANYYKMSDVFDVLEAKDGHDDLYQYDGESGWPQSNYLSSMFSTLYFRVAEEADETISDSLVRRYFVNDSTTAEMLIRKKQYLIAYDFIDALKDKYRGKMKLSPLRKQISALRRDRGYGQARREVNQNAEDEFFLKEDLGYFLEDDIATANFENLGYWDERIREFDTAAATPTKPYEQRVAKRMLGYVDNTINAYKMVLNSNAFSTDQAIFYNVLRTVIDQKDYDSYLKIISLAAKDNDEKTAYFYLEKLLKNDYKAYDALYEIPDTEVLHISPEYNALVKKYLGKSKF